MPIVCSRLGQLDKSVVTRYGEKAVVGWEERWVVLQCPYHYGNKSP